LFNPLRFLAERVFLCQNQLSPLYFKLKAAIILALPLFAISSFNYLLTKKGQKNV